MEHKWMGKYRGFVESVIFLCNCASTEFITPYYYGTDFKITAREAQVLEYLLEDTTGIMVEVANRLGVTRGAFSNIVNKLVAKGCLEKEHRGTNKKNIYPVVTEKGKETYRKYAEFINEYWFEKMFAMADEIPEEYVEKLSVMLKEMGNSMMTFKEKNK